MRHSIGALARSAFLGPPEATDITGGERDESGLEGRDRGNDSALASRRVSADIAARQIAMHIYGNPDAETLHGAWRLSPLEC